MVEQIHDYVEGLLGPDFFLWGGASRRRDCHSVAPPLYL